MPDRLVTKTGVVTSQRPAWPVLNPTSTLTNGLRAMFAAPQTQDLYTGLTYSGTYDQTGWPGIGGSGFRFNAVDQGLRRAAPPSVMLAFPFTIATHVVFLGTPTVNASIFGVSFNTAQTTPFIGFSIGISAAGAFVGNFNNGAGTLVQVIATGVTPVPGVVYSLIFAGLTGSQAIYVNGRQVNTGTNATAGPTYGVGPLIAAGELSVQTRNPNLIFFDGMIWNRVLQPIEMALLDSQSPWDLYTPPKTYLFLSDGPQPDTPPSQPLRPRYLRLNTFSPQASGLKLWFPVENGAFLQPQTAVPVVAGVGTPPYALSSIPNMRLPADDTADVGSVPTSVAYAVPSDFGLVPRSYNAPQTPQRNFIRQFQTSAALVGGAADDVLSVFTIVCWVYPLPAQTLDEVYWFVGTTLSLTNVSLNGNNTALSLPANTFIRGRWQMITCVRTPTSLTLWRDQQVIATVSGLSQPDIFNSGNLIIGGGTTFGANGRITGSNALWADFRVYDRGWNQNDVNYAYNPATRWDYYWQPKTTPYEDIPIIPPPGSGFLSRLALLGAG